MEFGTKVYDAKMKQIYLENMKVYHKPRNILQMKEKALRVSQGVYDLIRLKPNKFSNLKIRFSYFNLLKRGIRAIFFPWKDKVYKSGLIGYFDYVRIELSLIKNHIIITKNYFK